jgi:hypothetical protein
MRVVLLDVEPKGWGNKKNKVTFISATKGIRKNKNEYIISKT